MDDALFETLVARGVDAIPERFLDRLENVALLIADVPDEDQRAEMHLRGEDDLLGLYEGVPLSERGSEYGGLVLPDRITVFKHATLAEHEETGIPVEDIVRDTVWHEIAHYFGLTESDVEKRERAGTNQSHE